MIKKISFLIITLIFISSCANKFSLQKRKYNKGFYFSSSKHNSTKPKNEIIHNAIIANNLQVKEAINIDNSKNDNKESIVFNKSSKNIELKSLFKDYKLETKKNLTASANKNNISTAKVFKGLKLSIEESKLGKAKKGDKDVNFVVMVILCFFWFFNLIPVYLHDNKEFTLNFLITLILDFTYILGVVYALLVVLDIVDLA